MTQFSALLGAVGLLVSAPAAIALAQESPVLEAPASSDIVQFLSDSAPAECTIQTVSIPSETPEQNAQAILATAPAMPCDAVSGTDDGSSRNFNFLNVSGNNFYKVITSSTPVAETEDDIYQFSVEGVKVVPLNQAGDAANLNEIEYLYPSGNQVCMADATEQPRSVVCTFTVEDAGNVLVGQLSYVW